MKMTITEALAEIKTIGKRLDKRRQFIRDHLVRIDRIKDPLEDQGGTRQVIERELQAVGDLEERLVALRSAINSANQSTQLTIGRATRSVAEWIIWRREVSGGAQQFFTQMLSGINASRKQQPMVQAPGAVGGEPAGFEIGIDEKRLADDIDGMEQTLGTLDGQLSLLNATTFVEI